MGQEPGAIREDIEQTRERMGETVEALAHKADVKGRAKESVSDKVESLKSMVSGAAESVNDATPSTGEVTQGARKAAGVAQENPLGLALGAVAIGFIGGLLVPATRIENEKIGDVADQVKDQVRETAQTALDHGRQAAQEAGQAAAQAVKETGAEHVEQARADISDQVGQAREQVTSS
jgi:gas vesicle protein